MLAAAALIQKQLQEEKGEKDASAFAAFQKLPAGHSQNEPVKI